MSSAEVSSANRERNRANYHKKIQDARAKYAWEIGQRVRVVLGMHAGQCGAVMARSDNQHQVRLDQGNTARISPDHLEAWPYLGQRISWLEGEDGEVATVVQFLKGYEEPNANEEKGLPAHRWRVGYKLMRILYAASEHIECVDEDRMRVGSNVRLLEPHADASLWEGGSSQFTIKAICEACESVELEHVFGWYHDMFGSLELPADVGCSLDHEYKCAHLGHKGNCKYMCSTCNSWWDEVPDGLRCVCCAAD